MNIKSVEISKIKPASYNPRKISEKALQGLGASIAKFGYVEPIVWNERTGCIVGGHQRFEALKRNARLKEIECVVVDLDEVQERALNVSLNNRHIAGEWDISGLSDVLSGLEGHIDFEELRFDALLDELKIDFRTDNQLMDSSDETQFLIVIDSESEENQRKLYEEFETRGLKCRLIM